MIHPVPKERRPVRGDGTMAKVKEWIRKLYRMRITVSRKGTPVLNWSVLFCALCVILAPHMAVAGTAAALLLDYEFSFDREGEGFGSREPGEGRREEP